MRTTYMAKPGEVERNWYTIDAADKPLGRLASEVARLLRGKHKPTFTPHVDTGDFVIVLNAEKVALTGKKRSQKLYFQHSGYPGGVRTMKYETLLKTNPERAIEEAVKGMLPKNKLGKKMIKKLKVYQGESHPHQAQQPQAWEF